MATSDCFWNPLLNLFSLTLFLPSFYQLFTPHSHIVALRPTGNVFSYETIAQLNLKTKSLRDLLNDTPFNKKDIITLQDPHNMSPTKDMTQLHHLKNGMRLNETERTAAKSELSAASTFKSDEDEVNVDATGSTSKVLDQIKKQNQEKEEIDRRKAGESFKFKGKVPYNQTEFSTNRAAASLTSSSLTPVTKTEKVLRDEEELMFEEVSKKGSKGKGKAKAYVRVSCPESSFSEAWRRLSTSNWY